MECPRCAGTMLPDPAVHTVDRDTMTCINCGHSPPRPQAELDEARTSRRTRRPVYRGVKL